jgi:hypothetical protein
MPIHQVVLKSCNLLYVRFEGSVTTEEIYAGRKAASDNSDFHLNLRQLVDLRNGSMELVSSANLSTIGASTIFNKSVKRAFVVARDVDYGLLRMYGVFAEHHQQQIRIFRSLEEACEWLDIPISALPAE